MTPQEYKRTKYQVWYRNPNTVISNILSNPDFANEFDAAPYVHLNNEGKRRVSDFMSGNFAFRHSTMISEDVGDAVDGAMYCPIIIGADKTTVSVATGHVEYHPIYISIGNLRNCAQRGHRNGVIPVGFLAIPKADRKYDNDPEYRVYKKQLYHASIAAIFAPTKSAMLQPVVRLCPDGHYRRVIYDLAAFIADYPEQVYLAGIVSGWCCKCTARNNNLDGNNAEMRTREWFEEVMQGFGDHDDILWDNFGIDNDIVPFTHYFPRADIHEMLTADLLHQVIKGCFKDMLVEWVWDYIKQDYGDEAEAIMDDIDKRISVVPEFPGLRRFPQGQRFKQWTGDDSKALMKVFLPAVEPFIPPQMTKCLAAFLDFCYLVRRNDFDEDTISEIQHTVERFHNHRQIFIELGIRDDFSVPRMHSMIHYPYLILNFGAPNGVCSSITESRHITAVKKPWRRSNRHNALSQILLTNQRLDKLSAKRVELVERGLLPRLHNPPPDPFEVGMQDTTPIDKDGIEGEVTLAKRRAQGYSEDLDAIANALGMPTLPWLTRRFLHEQTTQCSSDDIPIEALPEILSKINVYHSAVATFRSPSDESGLHGMRKERIRASPSYRGHPRHDMVAVVTDQSKSGFRGMSAARVLMLFSFKEQGETYQSYLDARRRRPHLAVIHIDTILRGIHLVPVYGNGRVPRSLKFYRSLDAYNAYYVNNAKGWEKETKFGLTGTTHPVESAAMTPSVRVLRQTYHYIDIHLDAEVQHGSSEDTPGRNHTASSQPMPVLLQLGVDRESFLRSMVIRVGVIHTTTIPTDLNHPSHDTTLIDVDLEPSAASSESPKNHSLALQSSPNDSDNHCSSPSGSQTPSQNFDFTLTTQDSQLLSTQTANFLYMCEEREDLIVDRAARAIETASGKYFLRPEHLAEISIPKDQQGQQSVIFHPERFSLPTVINHMTQGK
ncbi:hypothetical protein AAF712_014031 [Marasmius tenuissimus]|uniref:Uncharacterized protein n=1 Tax=Marasmius tenuissimus TaxID=585030 RepID=A0ABR2ZEL9_9AGAR